jgi:CBS domain containing-hemolysin-like protein
MKFELFKRKKSSKIEEMMRENKSEIEEDEREMIRGVFELGETTVKAIMVPRTDVVSAPIDVKLDEVVSLIVKSGHSRIPVYEETIDNVIGFVYAKDLLSSFTKKSNDIYIKKILRPVLFVPEGKMIDDLLKEFKQRKVHIAVVVDEYGGMAGIVSLENILEEIVGEIQDEYDNEEEDIKKISNGSYICDARTLISDINEELSLNLPVNGSDTLGGFVFNLFGKIPEVNEKIDFDGIEFKIEKMEGRQIKKVGLTLRIIDKKEEKQE